MLDQSATPQRTQGQGRAPGPPGTLGVRNLYRFAADQLRMMRELAR